VSVVAAILAIRWDIWKFNFGFFSFVLSVNLVAKMAMWFMAAVAIISAVDYFLAFWKKIDKRVERRGRRPFFFRPGKERLGETSLDTNSAERMEANKPAKVH